MKQREPGEGGGGRERETTRERHMGSPHSKINAATGGGGALGGGAVLYAVGVTLPGVGGAIVVGAVVAKGARIMAKAAMRSSTAGRAGLATAAAAGVAASVVAGPVGVVIAAAVGGSVGSTVAEVVPPKVAHAVSSALCVVGGAVRSMGYGIVGAIMAVAIHPSVYDDIREFCSKTVVGFALSCVAKWLFPGGDILCSVMFSIVASPFVNWLYEGVSGGRIIIGNRMALFSHVPVCIASVGSLVYCVSAPHDGIVMGLFYSWVWASNAMWLSIPVNAIIAFNRIQTQLRWCIMNGQPIRRYLF